MYVCVCCVPTALKRWLLWTAKNPTSWLVQADLYICTHTQKTPSLSCSYQRYSEVLWATLGNSVSSGTEALHAKHLPEANACTSYKISSPDSAEHVHLSGASHPAAGVLLLEPSFTRNQRLLVPKPALRAQPFERFLTTAHSRTAPSMASINVTNVVVLDNPCRATDAFRFSITFEALEALEDGEGVWKRG